MPSTTAFEFADVVLVAFPFTDQSTTKKRPAVIVSSAEYNAQRSDVILMAVTSHFRAAITVGEVVLVHWQRAGLLKPSVLKPLLATIEKSLILRTLGELQDEDRTALRKSLDDIIGQPE
jgi:mRNA interferase MazF